jgi:hypothetical protein
MNDPASGPASIAALRDAILKGREPPPARIVASLASYRWLVVGTVCIGAFMGQVDSSITQLLLPRLELEFNAGLSTVSWVAVLLNVTRSCGVSVGVAAASSLLAWRLAVLTGSGHNTLHANAHHLLSAGRDVIALLGSFAAIAGAISLTQIRLPRSRRAKDALA